MGGVPHEQVASKRAGIRPREVEALQFFLGAYPSSQTGIPEGQQRTEIGATCTNMGDQTGGKKSAEGEEGGGAVVSGYIACTIEDGC